MKVFGIYYDNGESYDDHWFGLKKEYVYSSEKEAKEQCEKLNNPIFVAPSEEEYKSMAKSAIYGSYEQYVEDELYWFNEQNKGTYTVIPLEVIE